MGEDCLDSNVEMIKKTQEKVINKLDLREPLPVVKVEKESASSYDRDCTECKTVHPDPTPSELMIYLHAPSYKVCGITIETDC